SVSVVLRKEAGPRGPRQAIRFPGFEESREFLGHGVAAYRDWIEQSRVSLDPFTFGGDRRLPVAREGDTVFHTDYEWFGSAPRTFNVSLAAAEVDGGGAAIDLRVHRAATLQPGDVTCVATQAVDVASGPGRITRELAVTADDRYRYAVLGRMIKGCCRLDGITIETAPSS